MTHLVVRPEIDVRLLDAGAGLEAERRALDRVAGAWSDRMLPVLDDVFDRVAGPDVHLRIDRLDLDLGEVADLGPALERALRDALDEALPALRASARTTPTSTDGVTAWTGASDESAVARLSAEAVPEDEDHAEASVRTPAQARRQALARLLATGWLPWWTDRTESFDLDRAVAEALDDGVLASVVERDGPHLRRLAWQARPETVTTVVQTWAGTDATAISSAIDRWRWARRLDSDPGRADAALGWIALQVAYDFATGTGRRSASVESVVDALVPDALAESSGQSVRDWVEAARRAPEAEGRAVLGAASPSPTTPRLPASGTPSAPSADPTSAASLGDAGVREPDAQPPDAPTQPSHSDERAFPTPPHDAPPSEAPTPQSHPSVAEGTTYVRDAGLVLLAPFLPAYLDTLDLLDDGVFPSPAAQRRAVALVAHLASGRFAQAEPEMRLAKLLCGLDLDEPVEREITPSTDERAEADDLLRAVVSHWTAIGQTSPEGLRETFLARDGRLDRTDTGWALTVERRGVDVLVDAIPWPLGIVRLGWMDAPLFVTW